MKHIKVKWNHDSPDYPTLIYVEIDEDRFEVRKVEIFADGRIGYASDTESTASTETELSYVSTPSISEIASDSEFEPMEISKDEFEMVWAKRASAS